MIFNLIGPHRNVIPFLIKNLYFSVSCLFVRGNGLLAGRLRHALQHLLAGLIQRLGEPRVRLVLFRAGLRLSRGLHADLLRVGGAETA